MKEKDNIQELFSKGLENHVSPVRPEVWNGLQAKMAAAGIASGSAVAAKGLSALAKWFIGGSAASIVAVGTVIMVNSADEAPKKPQQEIASADGNSSAQQNSTDNTTAPEQTATETAKPANIRKDNQGSPVNHIEEPPQMFDWITSGEPVIMDGVIPNPKTAPVGGTQAPSGNPPATPAETSPGKNPVTNATSPTDAIPPKPASRSEIVLIPNIVTPNNDGANDYYFIQSKYVSDFSIVIMNSKGERIFTSSDADFKWDGTKMNGENAPDGNYIAIIIAKGEDGAYLKERAAFEIRR